MYHDNTLLAGILRINTEFKSAKHVLHTFWLAKVKYVVEYNTKLIHKLRFQSDVLLVRETRVTTFSLNEIITLEQARQFMHRLLSWNKEGNLYVVYWGNYSSLISLHHTEEFRKQTPFGLTAFSYRYFWVAKTCTVHGPYEVTGIISWHVKTFTLFIWRNLLHVIANY